MECVICFENVSKNNIILCNNKNWCSSKICHDCAIMMLHFSENQRNENIQAFSLPKCPECLNEYTVSSFKEPNHSDIYISLCKDFIKNNIIFNMEKVQQKEQKELKNIIQKENEQMIKNVRAKRLEFIEKSYPEVVKEVIKIALKSKLSSVKSANLKKIKRITRLVPCFNSFCKGKLNSHGTCSECSTHYCLKCDKKRDKINHICLKEDIETKEYMKNVITCPTCKVPVEKINGCNYITCALCRTNFSYTTGVSTVSGNHDKLIIRLKEKNFNDILEAIKDQELKYNVLLKFLKLEPEYVNKTTVKTPLQYEKYIQQQSFIKSLNEIKAVLYKEYDDTKNISYPTINQIQTKFNL